jgi:hypothetical protein
MFLAWQDKMGHLHHITWILSIKQIELPTMNGGSSTLIHGAVSSHNYSWHGAKSSNKKEATTCPYSEPDKSSHHSPTLIL